MSPCWCFAAYSEELTIGNVIKAFRAERPGATVYVYDNNSTDRTIAVTTAKFPICSRTAFAAATAKPSSSNGPTHLGLNPDMVNLGKSGSKFGSLSQPAMSCRSGCCHANNIGNPDNILDMIGALGLHPLDIFVVNAIRNRCRQALGQAFFQRLRI